MATCGASPVGIVITSSVDSPAATRPAGVTGSTDAQDPRTDARAGAGSGEAAGDAAVDDTSGSGSADRTGFRVGHRNTGTVWLEQADRQLCRASSLRRVQR